MSEIAVIKHYISRSRCRLIHRDDHHIMRRYVETSARTSDLFRR